MFLFSSLTQDHTHYIQVYDEANSDFILGQKANMERLPYTSKEWCRMFHPLVIDGQASISLGQLLLMLEQYSPNCKWKDR